MMDVSAISSLLKGFYSTSAATSSVQASISSLASRLASRLLEDNDSDGDGYLSASELSSLSSDHFTALDSDGDGKLSSSEVKTALQKYMDTVSSVSETGGLSAYQTLQALQSSPEGQLMKALKSTSSASVTTTTQETAVARASLTAAADTILINSSIDGFDISV